MDPKIYDECETAHLKPLEKIRLGFGCLIINLQFTTTQFPRMLLSQGPDLLLDLDFLVVSAGWRRCVWFCQAGEFEGAALVLTWAAAGWGEAVVLLEVGLHGEHVPALVAHVVPLILQHFGHTGADDCACDGQEVTHIAGFRDVLSGHLRTHRQTWSFRHGGWRTVY